MKEGYLKIIEIAHMHSQLLQHQLSGNQWLKLRVSLAKMAH